MSAHDSDGFEEALEANLRIVLTTAARTGELLGRELAAQARRVAAERTQQARELQARLDAERHAARAHLRALDEPAWWDTATPEMIAEAVTTARAWRGVDASIAEVDQRIAHELKTRYDIVLGDSSVNISAVQEAIGRAQQDGPQVEATPVDQGETALKEDAALLAHLDLDAAEFEPDTPDLEPAYDSADRRQSLREDLVDRGISAADAETRVRADLAQAKPAFTLTERAGRPAARARRSRLAPDRQRHHDLGR